MKVTENTVVKLGEGGCNKGVTATMARLCSLGNLVCVGVIWKGFKESATEYLVV